MSDSRVSVAVLVDKSLHRWGRLSLRAMVELTDAEIDLVVVDDTSTTRDERDLKNSPTGLRDVAEFPLDLWREGSAELGRLDGKLNELVGFDSGFMSYGRHTPIGDVDLFSSCRSMECEPHSTDGIWNELPDDIVNEIDATADVVIRFGFGLIRGRILEATDLGVLSFHHGDIREYRGRKPGFWEFLDGAPRTGSTLQRLDESIDSGEIVAIETVDIWDTHTWAEVRARQARASIPLLERGVRNLQDPDFDPERPDRLGELHYDSEVRTWKNMTRLLVKNNLGRLRWLLEQRRD